jgi:hypothetical protein
MELVCEEVPNGFLATISYVNQKTSTANGGINEENEGINEENEGINEENEGINEENEGINLLLTLMIEQNSNQRIPFFASKKKIRKYHENQYLIF